MKMALIPEGAKILDVSSFQGSTYVEGDTHIERVVFESDGIEHQYICYDGDLDRVLHYSKEYGQEFADMEFVNISEFLDE